MNADDFATADDLLDFVRVSPTPWHAVDEVSRRLERHGFRRLDEGDAWSVRAGDRVYVVRGGSSLVALVVGDEAPERTGIRWIGAHTDSPNLRIKPMPDFTRAGQTQAGVEVYGGVLLHTWLDRDLSLAGRVVVRSEAGIRTVLVDLARPLARIPSLAIHLDRTVNADGLKLNAQSHLSPVLSLDSGSRLDVRSLVLAELERIGASAKLENVLGLDLCFADATAPVRGGARGEYLFAPRLDNLAMCHAATEALVQSASEPRLTRGIALFDHEECGSESALGARSPFLRDVCGRIVGAHPRSGPDALARTLHRSFFVSADMAHAVHPNYADKHDAQHQPLLGGGPVIKVNASQRYATDGESAALFMLACERAGCTPQRFVMRSDLACGTTIGPITAATLGMRVVDVGSPMLSMHSVREMATASDVPKMIAVLRECLLPQGIESS